MHQAFSHKQQFTVRTVYNVSMENIGKQCSPVYPARNKAFVIAVNFLGTAAAVSSRFFWKSLFYDTCSNKIFVSAQLLQWMGTRDRQKNDILELEAGLLVGCSSATSGQIKSGFMYWGKSPDQCLSLEAKIKSSGEMIRSNNSGSIYAWRALRIKPLWSQMWGSLFFGDQTDPILNTRVAIV